MDYEKIPKLKDLDLKDKIVFLRTDYNVPLDKEGNILNDFRIKASLMTIKEILKKGAKKIVIGTHLGRPKTKEKIFQTTNIAKKLVLLTSRKVEKLSDCINVKEEIEDSDAKLIILENLRFYEEEKKNDVEFAKKLSESCDVFVNDAFGVCHRTHASVHAITRFLPSCIGLLVEKELSIFHEALNDPKRPLNVLLGGSKLETKLPAIQNLVTKSDNLLLGGAMVFTFFKAKGYSIGKSLLDKDSVSMAKILLNNDKIILPEDIVIADDKDAPTNIVSVKPNYIPAYMIGLDLGEKTISKYSRMLSESKTIIWNGPLGYYENKEFSKATFSLIKVLANHDGKVIVGGGDTASMVEQLGLRDMFYHVSTGGGASLKLLEGDSLPALSVLIK